MNLSLFSRSFFVLLSALVFVLPAVAQEPSPAEDSLPAFAPPKFDEKAIKEALSNSYDRNIIIDGDKVSVESGKIEDKYSDKFITVKDEWKKQNKQFEKDREAAHNQIIKDTQANCEGGANTLKLLLKKGFLFMPPIEEMCIVGGPGTQSADALEEVQKTVGLYPEKTSLPKNSADRTPAGEATDLTLMALNLLPEKRPGGYTHEEIESVIAAINAHIASEAQKTNPEAE